MYGVIKHARTGSNAWSAFDSTRHLFFGNATDHTEKLATRRKVGVGNERRPVRHTGRVASHAFVNPKEFAPRWTSSRTA